jgi:hypothetical protein
MYLQQLSLEGYTIYAVSGNIPVSEADHQAILIPIPPPSAVKTPQKNIGKGYMLGNGDKDPELEAAIRESMIEDDKSFTLALSQSRDEFVALNNLALSQSTRDEFVALNKTSADVGLLPVKRQAEHDQEQIRLKRLERFGNK